MAQTQAKKPISLPAGRGTIYDRLGNPLAIGEQAIDVDADPMQISDPRREARIAAKVLGIPVRPLYRQLSDRSKGFVYVQRKAPPRLAAKLMKRHLVGFTFKPDQKRVYPQGTVAAPVLGYAGTDNTGLSGLELELNKELKGTPGQRDGGPGRARPGRQHDPGASRSRRPRRLSSRSTATSRRTPSRCSSRRCSEWHAKDATAIVLDPRTGAILGMAQEPGYNANGYPAATAHDLTIDHAVTDVFEPGSVFKVVTIGGALVAARHHAEHGVPGSRLPPGRGPRDPRRGAARDRDAEGQADPPALVEHRHGPDRRALPRRERPEEVDGALRVRPPHRDRLPRREPRPPALVLVGLDDRHRPDRAGRLGHGDPARFRLRRDRERRRVDPAAPRRPRRRPGRRRGRSGGGSSRPASTASCARC